jgi:hypothetical protein
LRTVPRRGRARRINHCFTGFNPRHWGGTRPTQAPPNGWRFDGFKSLADAFRDAGYLTAAFTGGGYVNPGFGLGRGFDTYFAYTAGSTETDTCDPARFDGPEVFARTARWLRQRAGAPFFLFVHTYDAHDRCPVQSGRPPGAPPFFG